MASKNNHLSSQTEEEFYHLTPFSVYLKVGLALFALTLLTVVTAKFMHLGLFATPVAILIAVAKAALVLLYFMHLKYDSKINKLIFASSFFFVFVLFLFCVIDIFTRLKIDSTL